MTPLLYPAAFLLQTASTDRLARMQAISSCLCLYGCQKEMAIAYVCSPTRGALQYAGVQSLGQSAASG